MQDYHQASSRIGVVEAPAAEGETEGHARPSAGGWEKNTQGKLGPRLADLAQRWILRGSQTRRST